METIKSIAVKEFKSNINIDNGYTNTSVGQKVSTMELFQYPDGSLQIEWVVNDGEFVEHIGVWFDGKKLIDYDGVFEMPKQAIQMLEEMGYDCSYAK